MNRTSFLIFSFLSILVLTANVANAGLNFCGGQSVTNNVSVAFSVDTQGTSLIPFNGTNSLLLSYTKGIGAVDPIWSTPVYSCGTPPITTAIDCGDPTGTRWVNHAPVSQPPSCFCKSYLKIQLGFGGATPVSPVPNQPLNFATIAFHNPGDTSIVPSIPSYTRTPTDVLELQNFPTGINNDKFVSFTHPGEFGDGFFGLVLGLSNTATPGQMLMEVTTIYDTAAIVPTYPGDAFVYAYHPGASINSQVYNCDLWMSGRIPISFQP